MESWALCNCVFSQCAHCLGWAARDGAKIEMETDQRRMVIWGDMGEVLVAAGSSPADACGLHEVLHVPG